MSGGRTHTLWVDPGDPSRLLPPSWRERLAAYLLWAPVALSVGLGDLGWRWEPGMRLLSLMVSKNLSFLLWKLGKNYFRRFYVLPTFLA